MSLKSQYNISNESGSALVYILIAIALLAALTFSFMEPSSQQTSSQNTFKTVAALQGQADMIRSAIQECALSYPKGDGTIDSSGGGTDPGATRNNYPIKPNSTHYDGPPAASIGKTTGRLARDIRCPGQQDGANAVDHAKIFSGRSGKFLPAAPDLFEDWQYYHGDDGIFFWTYTDKTDAYVVSALTKLDEHFSECEADIVSSTTNVDLDSDGDTECTGGTICFRVRMITTGTAEWNGDVDLDESSC